ncbi:MAG: aspartate/glutamate racemase family protein [Xanthomonadaceae bacterium]|jgi:aspartate racemase|nr:aspartate/glutamate racemase family protein [Xanthomonadaceae bacterium]
MRTLGLLGGMSWESTLPYYRAINEGVRDRLGGLHSAQLVLHSVDFAGIERLQREDRWDEAGELLADAARGLARAGAEAIVLCTNTMHRVAPAIEAGCGLPLLHIGDAIGTAVRTTGLATVGLLGTRFTMEQDFLRGRLSARHGIDVRVPDAAGRALVHRVIYEELCRGRFLDESRAAFRDVMAGLVAAGAQGIVLGCTEIGLLVRPEDASVPLFDTTALHAAAAVDFALGA